MELVVLSFWNKDIEESFDNTAVTMFVLIFVEEAYELPDLCSSDARLSSWEWLVEKLKPIVLLKLLGPGSPTSCVSDTFSDLLIPETLFGVLPGSKTKPVLGMVSFSPDIVLLAISKAWSPAEFAGLKSVTLLTNSEIDGASEAFECTTSWCWYLVRRE